MIVMGSPWNDSVKNNADFSKLLVDVYCNQDLFLDELTDIEGRENLNQAISNYCLSEEASNLEW